MADHVFGTIAGDQDMGGVFAAGDAVLLDQWITLAVDTISEDQHLPMIVLEMHGRVNKTQDTLRANYMIPVADAGSLAGALYHAVHRLGTEQEQRDFEIGFNLGAQGKRLGDEQTKGGE